MRLNETEDKFFTYKQTAEILKAEGLGGGRANVSFAVKVSKRLKCVSHLGEDRMIPRDSLKAYIDRVKLRGSR